MDVDLGHELCFCKLWNCGNNVPQVIGNPLAIVAQQFDMRPDPVTGIISGAVYGNNQILCGNVLSTQWLVTEYKGGSQKWLTIPV